MPDDPLGDDPPLAFFKALPEALLLAAIMWLIPWLMWTVFG